MAIDTAKTGAGKGTRAKNRSDAEWIELIERQKNSGLSRAKWCRENGVKDNSMTSAQRRLLKGGFTLGKSDMDMTGAESKESAVADDLDDADAVAEIGDVSIVVKPGFRASQGAGSRGNREAGLAEETSLKSTGILETVVEPATGWAKVKIGNSKSQRKDRQQKLHGKEKRRTGYARRIPALETVVPGQPAQSPPAQAAMTEEMPEGVVMKAVRYDVIFPPGYASAELAGFMKAVAGAC